MPWWFNYPGLLLNAELEYPCLSGERRHLPCTNFKDSACPAELVEQSAWKTERRGFKSCPRQLFFFSGKKRVVFGRHCLHLPCLYNWIIHMLNGMSSTCMCPYTVYTGTCRHVHVHVQFMCMYMYMYLCIRHVYIYVYMCNVIVHSLLPPLPSRVV